MAGIDPVTPAFAARLSRADNVVTLLQPARTAAALSVRDMSSGDSHETGIAIASEIPAGHKVSLCDIEPGEDIIKYGFAIGRADAAIAAGEHVHVHNLKSTVASPSPPIRREKPHRVAANRLREFVTRCLCAAGAGEAAADAMADHLVEAHLRGVETHGLRRLKPYIDRIRAGGVEVNDRPNIDRSGSLLRVDGHNAIGHHVGAMAADAVAEAAGETGAAVALVRDSNHFGFAGYYATRIASRGMLAMVTSNGQVFLGPDGARRAILSNDPIAVAAPISDGSFFEFDMATSVTSRANVVLAAQRGETLPDGLALDRDGNPTSDAAAALEGVLLAFGGAKGFGFVTAIELLSGIVTGGAYADLVASKETDPHAPEGTGHFMLAIDLERAIGVANFKNRLDDLIDRLAALPMRPGMEAPRYPGKRRWELRADRLMNGIPLSVADYDGLCALAAELDLSFDG
jgi:LDH2 family malate/lactate/ureidoglycolate dehydrogenase